MGWAEIGYGCTTWPLVVLGHVGRVKVTQRQIGKINGGGPRPRGNGGEVGKSVSYISFIGGLFGFEQIKRNQGESMNMRGSSEQPALPSSLPQHNTRTILQQFSLLATNYRWLRSSLEAKPHGPLKVSGSRAGCAVPKIAKTSHNSMY